MAKTKTFAVDIEEGLEGNNTYALEAGIGMGIVGGFLSAILLPTLTSITQAILIGAGIAAAIFLGIKIGQIKVSSVIGNTIKGLYSMLFQLPKIARGGIKLLKALWKWIKSGIKFLYNTAKKFLKSVVKGIGKWWKAYKIEFKRQFIQPLIDSPIGKAIVRSIKFVDKKVIQPIKKNIYNPTKKFITRTIPKIIRNVKTGFIQWKTEYIKGLTKMKNVFIQDMMNTQKAITRYIMNSKLIQNSLRALSSIKTVLTRVAFGKEGLATYKSELLKSGKQIEKSIAGATAKSNAFTTNAVKMSSTTRKNIRLLVDAGEIQLNTVVGMYRPKEDENLTIAKSLDPNNWQTTWDFYKERSETMFGLSGTTSKVLGWTFGILDALVGLASGTAIATSPVTGGLGIAVGTAIGIAGNTIVDKLADVTSFIFAKIQDKQISRSAAFGSTTIASLFMDKDREYYYLKDLEEINKNLKEVVNINKDLDTYKNKYLLTEINDYKNEVINISNNLMSSALSDNDYATISGYTVNDKLEIKPDINKAHRFFGIYTKSLFDTVSMFINNEDNEMLSGIGNGIYSTESGTFKKNDYVEVQKEDPIINPRFMFSEYMRIRVFSHPTWIAAIHSHWKKTSDNNEEWIRQKVAALIREEELRKQKIAAEKKLKDKTKIVPVAGSGTVLTQPGFNARTGVYNTLQYTNMVNALASYKPAPTTILTTSGNRYNTYEEVATIGYN